MGGREGRMAQRTNSPDAMALGPTRREKRRHNDKRAQDTTYRSRDRVRDINRLKMGKADRKDSKKTHESSRHVAHPA
jgi:hypothetical protein